MSVAIYSKKSLAWAVLYSLFFLLVAGFLNYTQPYDPNPTTIPTPIQVILWSLCYAPLIIFPLVARWRVIDFGFSVKPPFYLASLLIAAFCSSITLGLHTIWTGALIEAFARAGEEVFFRGFLFLLLIKIFENKQRPWLWAVVGSSLVHTQTFQSTFFSQSNSMPLAYQMAERLFNVFLLGAIFALLRHWTGSILPGAIAHGALSGGFITLPFILIIYSIVTLFAYTRHEPIVYQLKPEPKNPSLLN